MPLTCQTIGSTAVLLCSNSFTQQCSKFGGAADSTIICEIMQAVLSQLAGGRGAASQRDCAKQPCLPADSDYALAAMQQEAER